MRTGLIVDDDALYLRVLRRSLEARGLTIRTCADIAGALACARASTFDFALVDLRLNGESGFDLIERLRALDVIARIVLVTGSADAAAEREARRRGADACLLKPVAADAIIAMLRLGAPA